MLNFRAQVGRNRKDDAERPFWISYADLMTALMVLFLASMTVALLVVTKKIVEEINEEDKRKFQISQCLESIELLAKQMGGVHVDKENRVIDFGDRARYDLNSYSLREEQVRFLRQFVPQVLKLARDESCSRWFKRVVVEGFTDLTGTYLHNLQLSLQRAHRVLCVLLDERLQPSISRQDREQIQELFLVGGYSFNLARSSPEASRRIELRLEFLTVNEPRPPRVENLGNFGRCELL